MKFTKSSFAYGAIFLSAAILAACGGGGGSATSTTPAVPIQMGGAIQGPALSLSAATVSTLAGSSAVAAGSLDGTGTAATFNHPAGSTTDGINLYVADSTSNLIRKIVIATGEVVTLAGGSGSADGTGMAASFTGPWGITTDGNCLYVADQWNNEIRKIAPSSGTLSEMTSATAVVTTLAGTTASGSADGTGTAASFNGLWGITTDGINLYVTDNGSVRKIAPSSGTLSAMTSANAVVTTLVGRDAFTLGSFPGGLTTDGSSLYVIDVNSGVIRRISPRRGTLSAMTGATAVVSVLAGWDTAPSGATDGRGTAATFYYPREITTDGSRLYVTDVSNHKVRMITPAWGKLSAMTSANAVVSSLTGTADTSMPSGAVDGAAASALFNQPYGITTDGSSLFVMDAENRLIRKIH